MCIAPITIVPITEETFPAWRKLRLRALRDHPDAFGSTYEGYVGVPFTEARDQFFSRQGVFSRAFGAFFESGDLIGIVGIAVEDGPKMSHQAFIWGMYVSPIGRGTGTADALIEAALGFVRCICSVLQVHLTVTSHNEVARRLYERHGFVRYGTEPRALRVNGHSYDVDLMVLMLDVN